MQGNLRPIKKEELLNLKGYSEREEEKKRERCRIEYVNKIIVMIYNDVIKKAKESGNELIYDLPNQDYEAIELWRETNHILKKPIPDVLKESYKPNIYMLNGNHTQTMKDIINTLKNLFPDCSHNNGWKKDNLNRWVYYILIKFN